MPKAVPVSPFESGVIAKNAGVEQGWRFPRQSRLLKTDEFSSVFNFRCGQSGHYVRVYAKPNQLLYARLGIVVGKKELRTAVARNLAKRTVREVFRTNQQSVRSLDIIVRIMKPFKRTNVLLVRDELLRLLHKSQRCLGS